MLAQGRAHIGQGALLGWHPGSAPQARFAYPPLGDASVRADGVVTGGNRHAEASDIILEGAKAVYAVHSRLYGQSSATFP